MAAAIGAMHLCARQKDSEIRRGANEFQIQRLTEGRKIVGHDLCRRREQSLTAAAAKIGAFAALLQQRRCARIFVFILAHDREPFGAELVAPLLVGQLVGKVRALFLQEVEGHEIFGLRQGGNEGERQGAKGAAEEQSAGHAVFHGFNISQKTGIDIGMKKILSIQSHVAFGYVGNRAAVFPLQRLGHDVIAINTVQFSNHTGYGDWTGDVFSADHIVNILEGLEKRGALAQVDGLLTGYLGDPAIGEMIVRTLDRLPRSVTWLCDPVMGDVGRGFFVRPGIPEFFKMQAVPKAKIITPNQFELDYLSGTTIKTLDDARNACREVHEAGPETILLTSLIHNETKDDEIQMLASSRSGEQYLVTTPRLPLDPAPNGAGDCTAALLLAHMLSGEKLSDALSKTAASVFSLFEETQKAGTRELALIQAQEHFAHPKPMTVFAL